MDIIKRFFGKIKDSWCGVVIMAIGALVFITTTIVFSILTSRYFILLAIAAMLFYYIFLR